MRTDTCVFLALYAIGVQCATRPLVPQQTPQTQSLQPSAQQSPISQQGIDKHEAPAQGMINPIINEHEMEHNPLKDNSIPVNPANNGQSVNVDPNVMKLVSQLSNSNGRVRDSATKLGTNTIGRVASNVESVVDGTDGILGSKSAQFNRVNDQNVDFFKQFISTAGTVATIPPRIGNRFLGGAESFMLNPMYYMNPMTYVRNFNPWRSEQDKLLQDYNQLLLKNLRNENPTIFYKLIGNSLVSSFFNRNLNLFNELLKNPTALEVVLRDPSPLFEFERQRRMQSQMSAPANTFY